MGGAKGESEADRVSTHRVTAKSTRIPKEWNDQHRVI